jgi:hypothetical protein
LRVCNVSGDAVQISEYCAVKKKNIILYGRIRNNILMRLKIPAEVWFSFLYVHTARITSDKPQLYSEGLTEEHIFFPPENGDRQLSKCCRSMFKCLHDEIISQKR